MYILFIFNGYLDFNIELLYQNARIFFKSIPSYIMFPNGQYCWEYADDELYYNNNPILY